MTPFVIAIVIGVLILAGAYLAFGRNRPSQDGVVSFRRHIDALSTEARREVIERVQHARETGKGK
jgi:hypothetical protein